MKGIYEINEETARVNRSKFSAQSILTVNLLGSPGAGKTSVLEKSLGALKEKVFPAVIEGDLSTALDAERISALGIPVIQINTNGGCHLDAKMIEKVMPAFNLDEIDLMIIENVGNLVCPAAFDLGQDLKVVVLSVTEGADKPAKYPRTFIEADAVVINKTDLLPYTDVNLNHLVGEITKLNPNIMIFPVSCREESGFEPWVKWLVDRTKEKRKDD